MIKKLLCALTLPITVLALTSCEEAADYEVGVLQLVTHSALDSATEGFMDALEELVPEGQTIDFTLYNPEADATNMTTMASKLVSDCDLVMGNATDAALALQSAASLNNKSDLPILFTSVTDPVAVDLVDSLDAPGGMITGTSDLNPVSMQIDLIADLFPEKDIADIKVGFFYNTSEVNSEVQVESAIEYALSAGYTSDNLIGKTVSDQASIEAGLKYNFIDEIDALYIPTDNLMASNMGIVSNVTIEYGVPVVCGEEGMVSDGGTLTLSVNYENLGRTTGEMAASILFDGANPADMPVQMQDNAEDFTFVVNEDVLTASNITLPDSFKEKYGIE